MIDRKEVLGALSGVRDPELDEPITNLEFVSELRIEGGAAFLRLRLPTYFCAPNFAYLMVADAREALLSVPGVERARVVLDDHHASDEINSGVNAEAGFDGTFANDDTGGAGLDGLRAIFRRKSFVSRQEQLCRALLADSGRSPRELAGMVLEDHAGFVDAWHGEQRFPGVGDHQVGEVRGAERRRQTEPHVHGTVPDAQVGNELQVRYRLVKLRVPDAREGVQDRCLGDH